MPTTRTSEKEMRVAERRKARNKSAISKTKTMIDKAEKLIGSGNIEAAKESVNQAASSLDKDAEKGVIHANNASRRKSRLIKKLNKAAGTAKK